MLVAQSQFDLAIVGAGPAGSAAAITAMRAGASVVLLEARQFPRHKVCGEFFSGEALGVLADLLCDTSLLQAAPSIDRTRLWLGGRMVEATVATGALGISRYQLDAELWKVAQTVGVNCRAESEVSGVEGDGPFRLMTAAGAITARALIIAAGRWSQFTADRSVAVRSQWIGLKAHFHEQNPEPATDLYFFENGYCGVQPLSNSIVNACAMVRSDCASSLPQVFQLHRALASRAAGWTPVTPAIGTAPLIYRPPQPVRGNILFAGDAAAFIDPFVGDGISIALRSGRLAANYLLKSLKGGCELRETIAGYEAEYTRQFAPLLTFASRVRSLLTLPTIPRAAVFELLRVPGVMPLIMRKTRQVTLRASSAEPRVSRQL